MIQRSFSATSIFVAAFGALVGVAGIEHGIGEALQGSIAPDGPMILSWPGPGLFSILGGEPALTIVPNLLVSGILTIFFSLFFLAWAVLFVQRKHGGLVLILLSVVMLLVGGGIFPPVFGIIIGVVATRIHAPLTFWRARLPVGLRLFLAKLWPWSLAAGLIAWLSMFPGMLLLAYFFGMDQNPDLLLTLVLCMVGFFFLTIVAGFAYDSQREYDTEPQTDSHPALAGSG